VYDLQRFVNLSLNSLYPLMVRPPLFYAFPRVRHRNRCCRCFWRIFATIDA
jgi:hypothetical protein